MIKQVAHICIGALDLDQSRHFYCDILGLEKGFDFVKQGEIIGFYVKTGANTFIEIFHQAESPSSTNPIIRHLCLEVDDLDGFIADVRAKGWAVTDKKKGGDESWQAWLTDPSGVAVEVMQYTAASSQFTGNPCQVDW
jgi:glyoxylase I family protein